jgi:hypothetical protein
MADGKSFTAKGAFQGATAKPVREVTRKVRHTSTRLQLRSRMRIPLLARSLADWVWDLVFHIRTFAVKLFVIASPA